jgi:hypothetical protein
MPTITALAPANMNAEQTSFPTNKTFAATGGSVVGSAIATIVLYVLQSYMTTPLPQTVEGAITIVVTALFTFAAGWFTPHGAKEAIMQSSTDRLSRHASSSDNS